MANLVFDFLHSYETGERRASDPADAYQYDEGHVLEAVVPVAVTSCEIQYWIRGMEKADAYTPTSITQNTDNTYTILGNIPNSYFETNGDLRVYIVVTDGDASITTYEGYIHIKERQMPEDYVDDDPENEATRVLTEAQEAAATATAAAETCEEVLESIPEDYSQLSEDVDTLKDGLGEITEEVQSVNFFSGYTENGGINNTSGADTTSTAYVRTGYIPIDASEETLYILRTTSPWGMRVFFYDETQTFISPNVQIFNGSATTLTGSASIPSNAVYVRTFRDATATGDVEFSYTQESEYTPYGSTSELKDKIVSEEKLTDELNLKIASAEDVPKIESDLLTEKTVNIFDGEFPNSGYFDANGADASSSSWKRTDYIPINPTNTTLYFLRTAQPYLLAYCFYDSTKTASGVRTNAFGGTVTELKASAPIPSNAAYIRMYTSASAYSGNLMLSYTDQDTYIPHGDLFFLKDASVSENNLDDALKAKVNKGLELTGKTIAFMGDSIIGNFYDATGVCAHLAEKTGATVINCAFGGSRIAYRYGSNVQYTYWNALSGAGLADAIASGDWTSQDTAVANMTGGLAYFAERLAQVKAVDWSTVDFIMWEYGTNDFMTEVKLDGADLYAYNYAYRHTIETILTAYPTIRIITVTPAYRWYQAEGVFTEDSNTHLEADYAGVQTKLTDFVAMAQTISREYQIPCIDDYYTLGANRYTRLSFFDSTDGTHPNAQGRERIAEHIASQLVTLI